ncbi:HAUS augmin-like complex subunit 1 [Brachionus plicatilis]|uniref:HAUS augmin-like complex subunit 1 n=1 Tax=Brachionus plicatilis TaxID=10195 RepID=A0A3M7QSF8_BRAPC|nr:HAUS augmin-like complex subunit 1 [Brachionus plicatilis]
MNKNLLEEIESLELKNYKYWSSYYAKEAEKTQALLRLFGFTKNDLVTSENCTKSINALVSIGQELKLDCINKENLMITLNELISKKHDIEEKLYSNNAQTNDLNEKTIQLNLFREILLKDCRHFESQLDQDNETLRKMEIDIQFMKNKMEEYKSKIAQMKVHNDSIDKNLFHENIVSEYQKMKSIQSELQEVKTKLNLYQGLPSNMDLAQLKIESLAKEIENIEHEIEKLMVFMD